MFGLRCNTFIDDKISNIYKDLEDLVSGNMLRVQRNDQADRPVGKATITGGFAPRKIWKCWGARDNREMIEQIGRRAKQLSQAVWISEDLKVLRSSRQQRNDRADRPVGKATITGGFAPRKIWKCWGAWDNREMTEQIDRRAKQLSQAVCTSEDRTALRSSRQCLPAPSKGPDTTDFFEERGVEREKRSTIFFKGIIQSHRQSDHHWNCFESNCFETSGRRDGEHKGFSRAYKCQVQPD